MKETKRKAKPAKVRVSIYLDEDVIKFFKKRAGRPNAPPYQTQINNELRAVMEQGTGHPYSALVNDQEFIAAVAERIRDRRG